MKAIVIDSPGNVFVKEVKRPRPRRGEILVEMRTCGVCGTDLEKVRGEALTPRILGHEVVGEVSEMGAGASGFRAGDRVFTHHHAPCYKCELCLRGEYTLCSEFPKHNLRPGGFAEYYVVPAWNVSRGAVLPLPEDVSYEEGSFIEPLGCCIRGLSKVNFEKQKKAIVYGAGPIGLLHLMLLQHYGYHRVVIVDPSEYRISFASRLGAVALNPTDSGWKREVLEAFGGSAPELAILATGNPAGFADSLSTVSRGGKILLFGAPPSGSTISLDLSRFFMGGVDLVPSYSTSEKETAIAMNMIESGELNVHRLVTHRFKLSEGTEAFRVAGEQKCIKAVVNS